MDGMGMDGMPSPPAAQRLKVVMQKLDDRLVPHAAVRYVVLAIAIALYWLRIWNVGGFYVVTYALGIYFLKLLMLFVQPLVDPEAEDDFGPTLPNDASDEHKPFVRKMPEYRVWKNAMAALMVAFVMTFFRVFDLHVFWPILLVYFVLLFFLTAKKQILHMWKHKYVPFNVGKKRYDGTSHPSVRAYEK
eukprot:TRINITY_DN3153_c0_g4_i1.p1 TRINITY_DN3153_c0_g4~~TRINITY_DN3153_c0_g4_i1.p1  ORF type:complete len:189 (+),score=68.80 TRINITY_DN3153_c0_g4_i1:105-671(+)